MSWIEANLFQVNHEPIPSLSNFLNNNKKKNNLELKKPSTFKTIVGFSLFDFCSGKESFHGKHYLLEMTWLLEQNPCLAILIEIPFSHAARLKMHWLLWECPSLPHTGWTSRVQKISQP